MLVCPNCDYFLQFSFQVGSDGVIWVRYYCSNCGWEKMSVFYDDGAN